MEIDDPAWELKQTGFSFFGLPYLKSFVVREPNCSEVSLIPSKFGQERYREGLGWKYTEYIWSVSLSEVLCDPKDEE